MKKWICLFFSIVLYIKTIKSEDLDKEFDRTAMKMEITVYVYKDRREVTRALKEHIGDITRNSMKRNWGINWADGWATWSSVNKKGTPVCIIHVIDPKKTKDYTNMETWGHELVHCMYGNFHKAGDR